MTLFTIKVEKVIVQQQNDDKLDEIIKLLKELTDSPAKQAIMDKLNTSIADIKKTV